VIYRKVDGAHLPKGLDIQAVGERLTALQAVGPLTPAAFVSDAHDKSSPLHDAITTWDVKKAAQKWWEEEAGYCIRSIEIIADDGQPAPAFTSVRSGGSSAYQATMQAMADSVVRAQIIAQAKAEHDAWTRRYHRFEELAAICEAVRAAA
jgi:hypothetical protein